MPLNSTVVRIAVPAHRTSIGKLLLRPFAGEAATAHYSVVATQADVRRIALSLPEVEAVEGRFAFAVPLKGKPKAFVWVWMERIDPKKPRVANPAVLAVRVANVGVREVMIAAEPAKFFTEPHYAGFPAVLVRLAAVKVPELRTLIVEARQCLTPPALAKRRKD
ncbi:MAG TPA: hypothetical protein VHE78_10345 [Gemmatimonadaceae bacterium]|nr:hypothetical protein [Gemmatimonadaceae bacterium]